MGKKHFHRIEVIKPNNWAHLTVTPVRRLLWVRLIADHSDELLWCDVDEINRYRLFSRLISLRFDSFEANNGSHRRLKGSPSVTVAADGTGRLTTWRAVAAMAYQFTGGAPLWAGDRPSVAALPQKKRSRSGRLGKTVSKCCIHGIRSFEISSSV